MRRRQTSYTTNENKAATEYGPGAGHTEGAMQQEIPDTEKSTQAKDGKTVKKL